MKEGIPMLTKKRNRTIDLVKFVACIMIVILHAFGSGGGIQEYIYLIGTFGIPLFFMVNGYNQANKDLSFKYVIEKAWRYFLFMAKWSLLISIPYLIKKEFKFFSILKETITGKGILYHLWFLEGIIVIYITIIVLNAVLNLFGSDVKKLFKSKVCIYVCLVLLTIVFISNVLMKKYLHTEIRYIIPAAFRIIDNGAYFIIGMHYKLNLSDENVAVKKRNNFIKMLSINNKLKIKCWAALLFCYITIIALSELTGIIWASSYYTFPLTAIGVILLFSMIMTVNSDSISDGIYNLILTSTGVWVLHPLVIKALNRICMILVGELNVIEKIIIFTVTLIICIISTIFINRMKYVNMLFKGL